MAEKIPYSAEPSTSYKTFTNYELCIICQGNKIGEPLRSVQSVTGLEYALERRQDLCATCLKDDLHMVSDFLKKKPKWHSSCRQTFTSKRNLSFIEQKIRVGEIGACGSAINQRCTRGSITPGFDFRSKCIICAEPEKPKKGSKYTFRRVETYERQLSFYEKVKVLQHTKPEVLLRVEGDGKLPIDMIAAEVRYHDACMKKFMVISVFPQAHDLYHEAFCDLIKEIDNELNNGTVFVSSILRDKYCRHLEIRGIDSTNYRTSSLKTRMKKHYNEEIVFWHQKGYCDIVFKGNSLNAGELLKEIDRIKNDLHENYIHLTEVNDNEDNDDTISGSGASTSHTDHRSIYMASQVIKSDKRKNEK